MGQLPAKPNLLLIMTDQDRGIMHFPEGWEEQNLVAMPRLRKHGITFTNAFCSTCMCSPSRATTFTGVNPPKIELVKQHFLIFNKYFFTIKPINGHV